MRLCVEPSSAAEVASIHLWINVGSVYEPPGLEGAAHFVEHMVFKGTERFGVGEVAASIEDMGGDINAWTAFEETVFHATVPADAAVGAMEVLAEMLTRARWDRTELERERLVILEELRGGDEDPDLQLGEETYARAYGDHPYGRPIIGTKRSIKSMVPDEMIGFYRRYYQPANACLAVSGMVDPDAITAAAQRCFGGGPAVGAFALPRAVARPGHKLLRRKFEGVRINLAFPTPGHNHPDLPGLDVLATAIGGAASARLETRLRRQEELCLSVGMHGEAEATAGMLVVSLLAREGQAERALAAAQEELAAVVREGIDEATLFRARAQILTDRAFSRETAEGRAHALAFHNERYGDPNAWHAYDAAVAAITPAQLLGLARQYLDPARAVTVAMAPPDEPLRIRPWHLGPAAPAVHTRTTQNEVIRYQLDNGVRILLEPDPSEVVSIRVAGLGGALAERASSAGYSSAWARTVARGVGGLSLTDFATEMERLGVTVGAMSGRSSQAVRGEFPADNTLSALDLFLDTTLDPDFPPEEVARVQGETREMLRQRLDHPEQVLNELIWAKACAGHPYSLPLLGNEAVVDAMTPAALRRLHGRWCCGQNLVVAVSGGFHPDSMLRRLSRRLRHVPAAFRHPCPQAPVFPAQLRRAMLRAGHEQAHLAIAWPGVAVQDPQQPTVEVISSILGGQSGRLFVELRERHGLAYAVGAASSEGIYPGLLICTVSTDPDRVDEAETRLISVVQALAQTPVPDEELSRARRFLVGASTLELQTTGARASGAAWAELYGNNGVMYRSLQKRVAEVTAAGVQTWAQQHLGQPLVIARVVPGE